MAVIHRKCSSYWYLSFSEGAEFGGSVNMVLWVNGRVALVWFSFKPLCPSIWHLMQLSGGLHFCSCFFAASAIQCVLWDFLNCSHVLVHLNLSVSPLPPTPFYIQSRVVGKASKMYLKYQDIQTGLALICQSLCTRTVLPNQVKMSISFKQDVGKQLIKIKICFLLQFCMFANIQSTEQTSKAEY